MFTTTAAATTTITTKPNGRLRLYTYTHAAEKPGGRCLHARAARRLLISKPSEKIDGVHTIILLYYEKDADDNSEYNIMAARVGPQIGRPARAISGRNPPDEHEKRIRIITARENHRKIKRLKK